MIKRDPALHPQAEVLLQAIDAQDAPPWNEVPMDEARQTYVVGCRAGAGDVVVVHDTVELNLPLPGRTIAARLYRPSSAAQLPLIVHFHGGGFVLGDLDSHDNLCRRLCRDTGALVLSVNYRLAPEHPFPAAINDALDAVLWALDNISAWGGDSERMILSGDSAGANLAAVTAIRMRDQGKSPALGQILLYPVMDTAMNTPSYEKLAEGYRLSKSLMAWYFELYLPKPTDRKHAYAAPLSADNLSNLPPTLIVTAGFDPLCDEGVAYAKRLKDDGTPVTHSHYPAMIHAFCNMSGVLDEGSQAMDEVSAWAVRQLSDVTSMN